MLAALLAACASPVPQMIREAPPVGVSLAETRARGDAARGTRVRWGGTVAGLENRATETWIEIVERALAADGQPRTDDQTGGRFLARVEGFLDPAIHATGRSITVAGTVEGFLTRAIGAYPYTYTVIKAEGFYLWPLPERETFYREPYWPHGYDPWYPWHPGGYPWPWPYPYRW